MCTCYECKLFCLPYISIGEGDEDGEENEEQALKRKPWGDSGHFCPVALVDKGVLWPGSQDTSARCFVDKCLHAM